MNGGEPGGPEQRVLLVEDQFLLAELMREEIENLGRRVVNSTGSVAEALALLSGEISAGLLDINLGTELVTPVVDELAVALETLLPDDGS